MQYAGAISIFHRYKKIMLRVDPIKKRKNPFAIISGTFFMNKDVQQKAQLIVCVIRFTKSDYLLLSKVFWGYIV